jgi:hypothetical protein
MAVAFFCLTFRRRGIPASGIGNVASHSCRHQSMNANWKMP